MSILGIGGSGLLAAMAQINITSENIANANTPGYTAQEVDLVADPTNGGVDVGNVENTGQQVDVAQQLNTQRQAMLMYDANAMVINVANQMYGTLLNMMDTDDDDDDQNSGT